MASYKELTSGATLPLILNFTIPILLGSLLQQTYSIIDAAIVGKLLGINELAAVGASSSVIFLILGFCNGCCNGFGIPIAQKFGSHDYGMMRKYIYTSLKVSLILSVGIAIISSIMCTTILRSMKTPEQIFNDAYYYLLFTFIGIPFTFFYNLLASIIRALGDSKTPFYFLLFSTILNIILDIFCILTLKWGVAGAAIATLISQGLSAILCYFYMIRKFDLLKGTKEEKKFHSSCAKMLLAIGCPMGLQFSITAIGSIMLQSANNSLGTSCVAAFTAGARLKIFFISPFESLGIAMATFTGQNYGAGKPQRIGAGIKSAILLMIIYSIFSFIIIKYGTNIMSLMFVSANDIEIIKNTELFMHTSSFFFPILGILCILRYTIQGAGYTTFAMISGVAEMIARTIVSIFAVPTFGYLAICYGDPMAWIAADIFLIPAFLYVYQRIKRHQKYQLIK